MKAVVRGLVVGCACAVSLGVLAFVVFPGSVLTGLFMAPAIPLVPILGPLVPGRLMDHLIPGGGAPAGVMLIVTSALLGWAAAATCMFLVGRRVKLRRSRPAA